MQGSRLRWYTGTHDREHTLGPVLRRARQNPGQWRPDRRSRSSYPGPRPTRPLSGTDRNTLEGSGEVGPCAAVGHPVLRDVCAGMGNIAVAATRPRLWGRCGDAGGRVRAASRPVLRWASCSPLLTVPLLPFIYPPFGLYSAVNTDRTQVRDSQCALGDSSLLARNSPSGGVERGWFPWFRRGSCMWFGGHRRDPSRKISRSAPAGAGSSGYTEVHGSGEHPRTRGQARVVARPTARAPHSSSPSQRRSPRPWPISSWRYAASGPRSASGTVSATTSSTRPSRARRPDCPYSRRGSDTGIGAGASAWLAQWAAISPWVVPSIRRDVTRHSSTVVRSWYCPPHLWVCSSVHGHLRRPAALLPSPARMFPASQRSGVRPATAPASAGMFPSWAPYQRNCWSAPCNCGDVPRTTNDITMYVTCPRIRGDVLNGRMFLEVRNSCSPHPPGCSRHEQPVDR